jgi:hypothetical protein
VTIASESPLDQKPVLEALMQLWDRINESGIEGASEPT